MVEFTVSITINPYEGLKPAAPRGGKYLGIVSITINPYEGLKLSPEFISLVTQEWFQLQLIPMRD